MMKTTENLLSFLSRYSSLSSVAKAVRNPREAARRAKLEIFVANNPRNPEAFKEYIDLDSQSEIQKFSAVAVDILDSEQEEIEPYVRELNTLDCVDEQLNLAEALVGDKPYKLGGMKTEGKGLYALVRILQPSRTIEVGVANGVSSLYILSALAANQHGSLISIDIPKFEDDHKGEWNSSAGAWIPTGKEAGWVVPDEYHDKWELVIGDMRDQLPAILQEDPVDLFVYDGPKAYYERFWALKEAHANSTSDAFFICDDLLWNSAFEDFCKAESLEFIQWSNVGFAKLK